MVQWRHRSFSPHILVGDAYSIPEGNHINSTKGDVRGFIFRDDSPLLIIFRSCCRAIGRMETSGDALGILVDS